MREIKFRVWDGESKKYTNDGWSYGWQIYANRNIQGSDPLGEIFEQFTGLRDKNGKDIYEGDIVSFSYCNGRVTDNLEVMYEKYGIHPFYETDEDGMPWRGEAEDCEVIGNIHENPELLNADTE